MTWLALFVGLLAGGLTGWVCGMLTIFKAFGHIIDLGKRYLVAQAAGGAPSVGMVGLGRREASEPHHGTTVGA